MDVRHAHDANEVFAVDGLHSAAYGDTEVTTVFVERAATAHPGCCARRDDELDLRVVRNRGLVRIRAQKEVLRARVVEDFTDAHGELAAERVIREVARKAEHDRAR